MTGVKIIIRYRRLRMPHDNQHSHVFLVDVSSIGEVKYKPGVSRISRCLRDCLNLAAMSSHTLVKSLGVIMFNQVGSLAIYCSCLNV